MRLAWIGVGLAALVGGCDAANTSASSPAPAPGSALAQSSSQDKAGAPLTRWIYSEEQAALQDKPAKLACVTSNEEVHLASPWEDTPARLCLRRGPGFGYDAMITLSKGGQFSCLAVDCAIKVRFDGGRIQSFSGSDSATDGSTHVMFLLGAPRLASALKHASKAAFALPMWETGEQEITFDVTGLEWADSAPSGRRRHKG